MNLKKIAALAVVTGGTIGGLAISPAIASVINPVPHTSQQAGIQPPQSSSGESSAGPDVGPNVNVQQGSQTTPDNSSSSEKDTAESDNGKGVGADVQEGSKTAPDTASSSDTAAESESASEAGNGTDVGPNVQQGTNVQQQGNH